MNKYLRKILLFLSFLLTVSFIFSDTDDCYDNISIRKNFFSEDIIGYYLSAIDIQSGVSNVLLFDYSVDFSNCNIAALNNSLDIYFKIDMYIPTFESYSGGPQPLAEGTIHLTNIPNDLTQLEFRNTDLSFDTHYLQGGTQFSMNQQDYSIFISDSDKTILKL